MEGFKGNQLVFHNEGGVVKAGGYIINSKILQSGGSAIKNLNVSNGNGLQKMAVPAGLFLIHENANLEINDINEVQKGGGVVSDSIFDRLIYKLSGKKAAKKAAKKTRGKKTRGKKTRGKSKGKTRKK